MVHGVGQGGFAPGLTPRPLARDTDGEAFAQVLQKAARSAATAQTEEGAMPGQDEAQLAAAARDIEAYFLKEMLAAMRKTIPEGGLFEKNFAQETYEAMLDDTLTEKMAQAGGIGLGELIVKQLRHPGW